MDLEIVPFNSSVSALYDGHCQAHTGDAGLDLYVPEDITIPGHSSGFVPLGISCAAFEEGKNVAWLLFPRSSICKTPLRLANSIGLIDAGYRGEIKAAVDNIYAEAYTVKRGSRIVQAVSFKGCSVRMSIAKEHGFSTERAEGGFGSTDKVELMDENKRQKVEL
ncbi:MAG: hypothetical protein KVP17_004668 [Porospora cf. gigantea B]|uniref:uncharacterized protein n=1 Tax=Porospora cf. gigantea B TaxID=2853592 RepID=UPI003571CEB6|nr:MAG: hypothetical protein KVP17_004668 [Porospora cf. gigantea B]